jgi:hypothetical protein
MCEMQPRHHVQILTMFPSERRTVTGNKLEGTLPASWSSLKSTLMALSVPSAQLQPLLLCALSFASETVGQGTLIIVTINAAILQSPWR